MSAAVSTARLTFILLLCLLVRPLAETGFRYQTTDGKLLFQPTEEFQRTANPHAILSLQSHDEVVVLVTSEKKRFDISQIYDGMPSTFEDGSQCLGRVMLSVDGEEAATFLVEGMFPPEEESTHDTVYSVIIRGEIQYTIMIHYPLERGDEGFEWATDLLRSFSWATPLEEPESVEK